MNTGRDNSLLKPIRKNTFTEGKVYDVGDMGEEDIKAFLDNESRARIQVTRLGLSLGYEFPNILFGLDGWKETSGDGVYSV